jgi:chemotaxis regulatin CheY-phosphate phosphatase CheZ
MPPLPTPAPYSDADYEMIAEAVLETARGRWFLSEFARRNRNADTKLVLEAVEKLEHALAARGETPETELVRLDLVDMMNAITRTKGEIAAMRQSADNTHIDRASLELDSVVVATGRATSDILAAAERVQEIAWSLREQGTDPSVCDLIDAHATEIYTACSFQDLTGQRIRKVIEVLRYLEDRINAMIRIWRLDDLVAAPNTGGGPKLRGEQGTGNDLRQAAVDELIDAQKQDVVWRDSRIPTGHDPYNLGDFELDDLMVFETSPESDPRISRREVCIETDLVVRDIPPPEAAAVDPPALPAPAAATEPAGAVEPAREQTTLESLTYGQRLALFG